MLRKTLIAAVILAASIATPTVGASQNAAAPKVKDDPDPIVWPETPCNLEHRMDIAVVDGLFFECQCMRLQVGYQCDWMIIAGVSSAKLSRRPKHHKQLRVIVHARIPAVVA